MIDPVVFEDALRKTSSLLVPPHPPSSTPSVSPIPTVIPNVPIYEHIGDAGSKTLWVVFAIMVLSSVGFTILAARVPVQKRLFHVLTTFITLFATVSNFVMATGDGNSYAHIIIKEVHKHVPNTVEHVFRQVFWVRYIDWIITSPLLLLELAFIAGLSGASIFVAIVADIIMTLLCLLAAFGREGGQRWGYYAIACIAYLTIVYQFVMPGRRAAIAKGRSTIQFYSSIGSFVLILWTLYLIVWGVSDGARKWGVDAEVVAYGVLDILAKPVLGLWLLFAYARNSGSTEGFWAHGFNSEGALRIGEED